MAENPFNCVWISTPPRTGSMWLFNVTREILRSNGLSVRPDRVPQADEQMFELARSEAFTDTDPARVWVFKVHEVLWADLPRSRIITSLRDPRDVLVSMRRFLNASFEDALADSGDVVTYTDTYQAYPPERLLQVRFADIEQCPVDLLGRIAAFLGVALAPGEADRIARAYSRESVRRRIDATTRNVLDRVEGKAPVDRDEVVIRGGQITRAFDVATGFQTGHVSDNPSGAWRDLLSEEQKRQVNLRFGDWLARHGFPPD